MVKFSLKELVYWWSLWIVCVSLLTTFFTAAFGLLVTTVWFGGTVIVRRLCGNVAQFVYSILVGFFFSILFFMPMEGEFIPKLPSPDLLLLTISVFFGLVAGTLVWGFAMGADWAFNRIRCREISTTEGKATVTDNPNEVD